MKNKKRGLLMRLVKDEEGFTSVGMGVALLLSLALLVSGVRVYDTLSYSNKVQAVADQAALAAEQPVADFCTVTRVCDASLFTLSVGASLLMGVGVVALCIPIAAEFGELCINQGTKAFDLRDKLYERMSAALELYQKALPLLSALKARELCAQNSDAQHKYQGVACVFPLTSPSLELNKASSQGLQDNVEEHKDQIKDLGAQLDKLLQEAANAKEEAFKADCGNEPGYCMSERARTLAYLEGADNPLYSSPDTWPIEAGLKRAQAYYQRRSENTDEYAHIDERAREVLRHRFYEYARETLAGASVVETEEGASVSLPHLPRNTEEMKKTRLFTDRVYPIVNDGGTLRAHVWEGSARKYTLVGYKSLMEIESEHIESCKEYDCSPAAMGKVAQASTSIDNGFEYHFKVYGDALEKYQQAREKAKPLEKTLKESTQGIFEDVRGFLQETCNKRIKLNPPGKDGAVAFVFDTGSPKTSFLGNQIVYTQRQLGPSFALAGSRLAPDSRPEAPNVIEVLAGSQFSKDEIQGLFGALGSLWTQLLKLYKEGYGALTDLLDALLNQIPLVKGSSIARGISEQFKGVIKECGFAPVRTELLKPAIVNTRYVVERDADPVGSALRQAHASSESISKHVSNSIFEELKLQAQDALDSFTHGDTQSINILGFSPFEPGHKESRFYISTALRPGG